ncbi:hypothetical protein ABPG72_020216 [Tetrahymena utriculariae]
MYFQNCLEGMVFYDDIKNSNQNLRSCIAVFPKQYIQSLSQNTCNKIESCTLSYSSKVIFDINDYNPKNLLAYQDQTILIQLNNQMVLITRQNGQILQIIPIQENIITIYNIFELQY